jgi:hypothetical protein
MLPIVYAAQSISRASPSTIIAASLSLMVLPLQNGKELSFNRWMALPSALRSDADPGLLFVLVSVDRLMQGLLLV